MKKYKYGIYSKKHKLLRTFITILVFLIAAFIGFSYGYFKLDLLLTIFLVLLVVIIFLIIMILIDPLVRLNFKLNKTADTLTYLNRIDELLKDESICDDSRSFLLCHKVNVLCLEDLSQAIETFSSIKEPLNPIANKFYHEIRICLLINQKDFKKARSELDEWLNKDTKHQKVDERLRMFIQRTNTTIIEEDIEKKLIYNYRQLFIDVINLNNLIDYYEKRIDILSDARERIIYLSNYFHKLVKDNNLSLKVVVNNIDKELKELNLISNE